MFWHFQLVFGLTNYWVRQFTGSLLDCTKDCYSGRLGPPIWRCFRLVWQRIILACAILLNKNKIIRAQSKQGNSHKISDNLMVLFQFAKSYMFATNNQQVMNEIFIFICTLLRSRLSLCLLARVMFYKLKQTVSLFSDQVFVIAAIEDLKNLQFEKFLHLKLDQREAKSPINFHARMHSSTNYGKRI